MLVAFSHALCRPCLYRWGCDKQALSKDLNPTPIRYISILAVIRDSSLRIGMTSTRKHRQCHPYCRGGPVCPPKNCSEPVIPTEQSDEGSQQNLYRDSSHKVRNDNTVRWKLKSQQRSCHAGTKHLYNTKTIFNNSQIPVNNLLKTT